MKVKTLCTIDVESSRSLGSVVPSEYSIKEFSWDTVPEPEEEKRVNEMKFSAFKTMNGIVDFIIENFDNVHITMDHTSVPFITIRNGKTINKN